MTDSLLVKENNLLQADSGLWRLPGADPEQAFAYSDGDSEEAYVLEVIANASDTSSTSTELESYIHDWPSEYHLTTKRAHLLRALDLSGLENVLELGCGCGAISRYLAEQGLQVDAIEGSSRRASIALSRCRDLKNINIINSNFNHLQLPAAAYDAVFLIGVLEYAKRFCPDAADDRSAVLEILAAVQNSLKPGGVVITAIENRLGLKYLMGATEDHYGVPYIGIHRYPESAGIRTYDQGEWRSLLADAGLHGSVFLAPFPDYKIPSVVLHEEFLKDAAAASHLRGAVSRDYLRALDSNFDEYLFWQACSQNGSLLEFSNSYLIVTGSDKAKADRIAAYDFAHFTGSQRKAEFRTATRKRRQQRVVNKEQLSMAASNSSAAPQVQQICLDEDYLEGELLADVWLQNLMIWQDQNRLLELYKQYYKFIRGYSAEHPEAGDIVDMLPFNIIIDETGTYRSFDREWQLPEDVDAEFVMFRALFWFVYGNSRLFAGMFESYGWKSIRNYLLVSLSQLGIDVTDGLDDFAAEEDRIQAAIGTVEQDHLVGSLLDSLPQRRSGDTMFYPRLYWAQAGEALSEQQSIKATAVLGADRQTVTFDITRPLAAGSTLRFDPAEREGYFHLYSLRLLKPATGSHAREILLELHGAEAIAEEFSSHGISLCGSGDRAVFLAHDNDPHLHYKLPAGTDRLHVEIEMDWPHSEEYEIARDGLRQQFGEWIREKKAYREQLDELESLQVMNRQLQADHDELQMIKASRTFRLLRKLTGVLRG